MAKEPTTKQMFQQILAGQQKILDIISKVPTPIPTPSPTTGKYYVNKDSVVQKFINSHPNDPNISKLQVVASQPTFDWYLGTEDQSNQNAAVVSRVTDSLKKAAGQIYSISLYAMPGRDAGGPSAGGLQTVDAYKGYVGAIGYAIEKAGNPPVVVAVETDALGLNLPLAYTCINAVVDTLRKNSNTKIYLCASDWVDAADMAGRLNGAGVARTEGVASNIAGFAPTSKIEGYLNQVMQHLPSNLKYIIDTSRNGGSTKPGIWENPIGWKLGALPNTLPVTDKLAGNYWIKLPGESDGPRIDSDGTPNVGQSGAPNAGELFYSQLVSA